MEPDVAGELQRLVELHASGALTDEEFAAAKAKAIAGEPAPTPVAGGVWSSLLVLVLGAAGVWFAWTYREPSAATALKQAIAGDTQSLSIKPSVDHAVVIVALVLAVLAIVNLASIALRDSR